VLVEFNPQKIADAIFKAVQSVGGSDRLLAEKISDKVIGYLEILYKDGGYPSVESVQDLVEKILIEEGHAKTAKAYILYRQSRSELRKSKEVFSEANKLLDQYLTRDDWKVNENSNMTYSLQGLNNYISTAFTKHYWLNKIYPQYVRDAHDKGDIHIHDLGLLSVYCCGWDLKKLLTDGFRGAPGKIESKPAKHLRTALGQIVNFFYTLQGESAGAQAFSRFDTYLSPFIRYDELSYDQVKQAIQEFLFNMNIPTRVGFQTPFTNITMDIVASGQIAEEAVIIGGKMMDKKYGDFQAEMDMFNRAFIEVMIEGDAKGRIFTFPIPTYNVTKDFEWDRPIVKQLFEMTAKYGIPYFANFVNSDMSPDDARSMCCRLRLDNRELRKRGGGLFGSNPLTGSIGVVTINLPRMAYLSRDEAEFRDKIKYLMEVGRESLEIKRKILEQYTRDDLYPFSKYYLGDIYQQRQGYWDNHFSTIGLVGMHEAAQNLIHKGINTPEGRDFALRTLEFMRDVLQGFQAESGHMYNLEATPAEGTSYRLALKDKKEFGDIITSGKEEPYYTNSSQLPVDFSDDIFEVLEHQDELQTSYTGGTVVHLFIGEKIENGDICKRLVKKITDRYHLPYFTISPTFSVCPVHGYIAGEHHTCTHTVTEKEQPSARIN
jgi:ribonucleoside-triphosphate reductase